MGGYRKRGYDGLPSAPAEFANRVRTPLWEAVNELVIAWRSEVAKGEGHRVFIEGMEKLGALVSTQFDDRELKAAGREVREGWKQISSDEELMWQGLVKLMKRANELEAALINQTKTTGLHPTKQAANYLRAAINARGYKMGTYAEECRRKGMSTFSDWVRQPSGFKHEGDYHWAKLVFDGLWDLGQVEGADALLAEAVSRVERLS